MPVGTAFIRIVTALILSIPLLLSFAYYLGAASVSNTLLRPAYLLNALEENELYERIYSEVLMEGQFTEWMDRLAGGLEVSGEEKVGLLREVIPPEYVRQETERNVASIARYINGSTSELSAFIDLGRPLENVRPAVLSFIDRRIDALESSPVMSTAELAEGLGLFMAEVADGHIPTHLPMPEGLEPGETALAYEQALASLKQTASVPQRTATALEERQGEMRTAVESGDVRGALKIASHILLEPYIDGAIAGLSVNLDSRGRLDLVQQVAKDSGRARDEVVRDARIVRHVVHYGTGTAAQWAALGVMALCALAIFLVFLPYWRHAIFWPSAILLVYGLMALAFWWLLVLDMPFWTELVCQEASGPGCNLTLDITRSIALGLGSEITGPSVIVVLIGMAGVLLSLIMASFSGRRPALESVRK